MKRIRNEFGTYGFLALCAATAIALPAQTLTTLYSFDNTHGANPFAGLVQATNGEFYGTTYGGGASGKGVVFKIAPSGALTTLHSFCAGACDDGGLPVGTLIQATNGDLYGTNIAGGANGPPPGTAFQITPSGTLTTIYNFCALMGCTDGEESYGGLIQGTDGNLYGTTRFAGTDINGNGGTVFRITPGGALKTLYNFCTLTGCADGQQPNAVLVQAANGDFYGTTLYGGSNNSGNSGTIFKITPSGGLTTLYNFCAQPNCADGSNPVAGLIQAANGDFYGTTQFGGDNNGPGNGTVFKITPSGGLTTIYTFCPNPQNGCPDGQGPTAGLIQATDGNLYGTTTSGGNGYGTIFKITPSGTLTTLHSFLNPTDGQEPYAALIQATDGNFYGTTFIGGANGFGSVYKLSVGLSPFVATNPTSGKVGTAVKILGTDLTGTTSVKFHGIAAAFTVVSKTEITTKVPAGATTGEVKVVTPRGTLASNVEFRVP